MTTNSLTAQVRVIKLLEFKYDRNFKAAENTPLQFSVQVKHRIPTGTDRLEIAVLIIYSEKNIEPVVPLVSAECLTVYHLEGAEGEIDEEAGVEMVTIPDELMRKLYTESIAHCRALMAAQTTGTIFGGTHVEIKYNLAIEDYN